MNIKNLLELNFKDGEKIKVSPIGEIKGLDGREYKLNANILLEKIKKTGLDIPLDLNHSFGEAIGWFDKNSFELREDGIYASLELNEDGKNAINNKKFKYLSPVFEMGEDKEVINIDSIGLVNRPNILNNALNNKFEQDLAGLKQENLELKKQINEIRNAKEKTEDNTTLTAINTRLENLESSLKLFFGKKELEKNSNENLSVEEKKIAEILGITCEEYKGAKG